MINNILNKLNKNLICFRKKTPFDMEDNFIEIYDKVKRYTMTSIERMYALYTAVNYIERSNIDGDIAECGVWEGGSMMLVALTLLNLKSTKRKLYLYDTFSGMSKPTSKDILGESKQPALQIWKNYNNGSYNSWCYAPLNIVKQNMYKTNYPINNIFFIKGKVENTIPNNIPNVIALLRLDTDWYESTKHELKYLFPKLQIGGVLIIDDYGHWKGARKATEEYFSKRPIYLNRIDYTARVGIKLNKHE